MSINMSHYSSPKKDMQWHKIKTIRSDRTKTEVHHAVFYREAVVVLTGVMVTTEAKTRSRYKVSEVSDHIELFDDLPRTIATAKNYVEKILLNNIS